MVLAFFCAEQRIGHRVHIIKRSQARVENLTRLGEKYFKKITPVVNASSLSVESVPFFVLLQKLGGVPSSWSIICNWMCLLVQFDVYFTKNFFPSSTIKNITFYLGNTNLQG